MFSDLVVFKAEKLTHAEKQRRYRAKLNADSEKRQQYLAKAKARYQQELASGKRKKIHDMTESEAEECRNQWRNRQKYYRVRNKLIAQQDSSWTVAEPTKCRGLQMATNNTANITCAINEFENTL